jgi:hypothetical protein
VLLQALREGSDVRVLIVSDAPRAMQDLSSAGQPLARIASIAPGSSPNNRLRMAGDADGILPYSKAVDGHGRVCARWRGMLSLSRIRELLLRC